MNHLLSDVREKNDCDQVTDCSSETIDGSGKNAVILLNINQSNTKNRTVGGDQRKVDSKSFIEAGNELLQEHLNELNQRCNDNDEDDGLHIFQMCGNQNELIDNSTHKR